MKNAVYADTEDPHHNARVVEAGAAGGGDLLIVAGEEHDQGITPESYTDVYTRCTAVYCIGALALPLYAVSTDSGSFNRQWQYQQTVAVSTDSGSINRQWQYQLHGCAVE